jgi:hypothetical protein
MINYKNILGKDISINQFNLLDENILETIDDNTGELKIIETTRMGRQFQTKGYDYFLDISEDKNNIIQWYMTKSSFKNISIYKNKTSLFGFTTYDVEDYNIEGVLSYKSKHVYDSLNRIIFYCSFDLLTNEIIKSVTPVKYYYGNENDLPDLILRFTYEFNEDLNEFVTYVLDQNKSTLQINTMDYAAPEKTYNF